jgi:release factor glutamine methyltransferase
MHESVETLIVEGRKKLGQVIFDISLREANLLLAYVMGWSEAELMARTNQCPAADRIEQFRELIKRRAAGEPVAYIVGEKEFFGRSFKVDDRVLIPRPETEHLVEAVLGLDLPDRLTILDIGTGSGCLAVSLALEIPRARILATDISPGALAVASENSRRHRVDSRISAVASDLAGAIDLKQVDLVVSNPPYVAREVSCDLSPEILNYEPHHALFAGSEGDLVIRRLFAELRELSSGVWLAIEIGYDQEELILQLGSGGVFQTSSIVHDYSDNPRVALLRRI